MNPVADMLLNEPAPAAIWATLMLLCLPALILLASPQGVRHPRLTLLQVAGTLRGRGEHRRRRRAEVLETIRYADEMRVAANQAAFAAQRWQERRAQAEERATAAWTLWQDAAGELTRLRAAAAYANPWSASTPAEYAERERYLHRTVRAAAGRGDLPAAAVADALAGRGWDARLHAFDQDVAVARAIATHRRAAYLQAAAAEATATHDAHLAIRSSESLRQEYVAAAVRAAGVHHLAPAVAPAATRVRPAVLARTA